jgi:PhnB protein
MTFDVFLNFDGDCRAALEFYANVFGLEITEHIMTYGQNPEGSFGEENNDRILYASLPIFGSNVMFSDCPSGSDYVKGTNIALTLGTPYADKIKSVFNALADGGEVIMPLGKTFFSDFYGMVTDKFGITWQLSQTPFED